MTTNQISILIVDDEPLIRDSLFESLRIEGYKTMSAANAEDALKIIEKTNVNIVLTDLKLPQMSGIELLTQIKKISPQTEIILITGYGSVETAVEAMKKGAFDYITKPINDNEIRITINKIIERKNLLDENASLKEIIAKEGRQTFSSLIGCSAKMQSVYNIIESVASSNATILITGESGTGKSLVAKAIHENDQNRKDKPFVEISCGAISETLLESELFGHAKGAFTGAIKDKEGRFEFVKGGTLFLDEIDAFSLNLQVKLLRILQTGIYERVGENVPRKTECRIIVATNQNITGLIAQGAFREDLYYRINVISIQMPSLRERKVDLPILIKYFLEQFNQTNRKNIKGISKETETIFNNYHWPGNVRELENILEGAVIMAKTDIIQKWDIPNNQRFTDIPTSKIEEFSLRKIVEQPEKEHIVSILKQFNWNRIKAAQALGVNRTTLYNKMKKYNISQPKEMS